MSWLALQTKWRAPLHPGGTIAEPLYINNDNYIRYLFAGVPTISLRTKIGYSFTINDSECLPNYISYGGYTGFIGSTYNIWYDLGYGWVASTLDVGTPLYEYFYYGSYGASIGYYTGTSFYTIGTSSGVGTLPSFGSTLTAYGRGTLRGTTYGGTSTNTLSVGTAWEYWTTEGAEILYGKYSPAGTASEDKYMGSPQWKNGTTKYCRNPTAVSGKFEYGSIVWNISASKYVLGTYNSVSGWHESSSAPTVESSWTLQFAKPEDSDAEGENITLEWDNWVLGTYSQSLYAVRSSNWSG